MIPKVKNIYMNARTVITVEWAIYRGAQKKKAPLKTYTTTTMHCRSNRKYSTKGQR